MSTQSQRLKEFYSTSLYKLSDLENLEGDIRNLSFNQIQELVLRHMAKYAEFVDDRDTLLAAAKKLNRANYQYFCPELRQKFFGSDGDMFLYYAPLVEVLKSKSAEFNQAALLREFLNTPLDQLPSLIVPDDQLVNLDINLLQAVFLRRFAKDAPDTKEGDAASETQTKKATLKKASTELLNRPDQYIDPNLLDMFFNTDSATPIDYAQVIKFLKAKGVTNIPILSDTPEDIVAALSQESALTLIPVDQLGLSNFDKLKKVVDVPQWFTDEITAKKSSEKSVPLLEEIRKRWYLLVILMIAILTVAGTSLDVGFRIRDVLGSQDFFLSIYGAVAISRSIWQISRAEKWNRKARNEIRGEYYNSLNSYIEALPDEELKSRLNSDPRTQKVKKKLHKTSHIATAMGGFAREGSWDKFRGDFGLDQFEKFTVAEELQKGPFQKKPKKQQVSQLEELTEIINEHREQLNTERGTTDTEEEIPEFDRKTITREMVKLFIKDFFKEKYGEHPPTVAVTVPTYQTSLPEMAGLLYSLKNQLYPINNVYVVYNDNPNANPKKQKDFLAFQALISEVNSFQGSNDCKIHLLAQPARGKREAMAMGFAMGMGRDLMMRDLKTRHPDATPEQLNVMVANLNLDAIPDKKHDFILNIDSDTKVGDEYSLLNSMIMMHKHENAGTLTGDVRVVNRHINLLSEMTFQRYWRAFFVERAAQSPQVTCMSGPWVLMRAEALAQIIDGWYFQEFLGNRCTYGDDRHISTLMLELGMESLFCPDSFVLTDCPIDWKVFIKQQLRWNKSFNRENLILLTFIHKMSKFVQTDVVYQQTFPFIMLYILANLSTQAAGISLEAGLPAGLASVLPYAGLVVAYNELFFGIYGAFKNRDINYLKSPVYIGYHFGRLLWLKLEAIIKAKDAGWGTKDESLDPPSEEQLDLQIDEIERLVDEAINSVGFKPKAKGGAQTATEATKAGSTVNSKGPDHTDDGGAGYSEAQAEM